MEALKPRVIEADGTPESEWLPWRDLQHSPSIAPDALLGQARRLVVVAPHPDDEVIGSGGLIAWAARMRCPLTVLAVTAGEGSHPGSSLWTPARLRTARRRERLRGLRRLGVRQFDLHDVDLADGEVGRHASRLVLDLRQQIRAGDVVIAPWRSDGHPDHDAVGRAVILACREKGVVCGEVPIWMWHWASPGDRRVPWTRLRKLRIPRIIRRRKLAALAAHRSQWLRDPTTGRPPVLPPTLVSRMERDFEAIFVDA